MKTKKEIRSELKIQKELAKIHLSEMKKKNSIYPDSDYVYKNLNSDPKKEYKSTVFKIAELTIELNCR